MYTEGISVFHRISTPLVTTQESRAPCRDHVVLQDGTDRQTVNMCGSLRAQRHSLVFTSADNSMVIHTRLGRGQKKAYFMLQYTGKGQSTGPFIDRPT